MIFYCCYASLLAPHANVHFTPVYRNKAVEGDRNSLWESVRCDVFALAAPGKPVYWTGYLSVRQMPSGNGPEDCHMKGRKELGLCILQGPKLPCSCRLHTLPRLRASQGSNLCEANSRRYWWYPIKHLGMPVLKDEPRVSPCAYAGTCACASVL